jgi:hypothetical protein
LRGLRNGGSQFVRVEHVHVDSFVHLVAAFRKGLSQSGYVEGQNVTIEFRWALNDRDQFFLLCCTNTTLFEGPRPFSQMPGRIFPLAHAFGGTAWSKPCFCFHAEPRS